MCESAFPVSENGTSLNLCKSLQIPQRYYLLYTHNTIQENYEKLYIKMVKWQNNLLKAPLSAICSTSVLSQASREKYTIYMLKEKIE